MTAQSRKLYFLPGDGIGPEIMAEVRRIAEWMNTQRNARFELSDGLLEQGMVRCLMPFADVGAVLLAAEPDAREAAPVGRDDHSAEGACVVQVVHRSGSRK